MVERARGGERARELRHRERHEHRPHADERPAEAERRGTAWADGVGIRGDAAGENADDREADGEAREPAHATQELLRVPETAQRARVGGVLALTTDLAPSSRVHRAERIP